MRAENQANVTCQVTKFYPQRLQLTWLENGNVSRTEMASSPPENKDGTYNWTSWLLVNVSAHRDDVKLTCQVEHDGQPAVNKSFSLKVSAHLEGAGLRCHPRPGTGSYCFTAHSSPPGPQGPTGGWCLCRLHLLETEGLTVLCSSPAMWDPQSLLPPSFLERFNLREGASEKFLQTQLQTPPLP
ncbi:hypothetical protein H8959_022798 [Pygathrix nigripes]